MSLSAGPGGRPSGEPDARGRSGGLYRKARGRLAARSYHRAMRTPRSLALPASWDVTGAAAGPAMTVLVSVVTRIAAALRVIGIGYVMLQVIIWHSFYAASPWLLWGPAVTVGWGAHAAWYLRRRPRRWPLACLDSAVYAGLALSASGCVPLAIRGQPGNWLFIAVTTQLIVPIWFAPAIVSMPLAILSGAGYAAGNASVPVSRADAGSPLASSVLFFAVVAVHWSAHRMLTRRASRADAALAAAQAQAREQYVILSRNLERREQDRLLHDTVLNTLTAIARSGAAGDVTARCRHDIRLLVAALREPADPPPAASVSWPGLLAGLAAVASELRDRGLAVHLESARDQAAAVPAPRGSGTGVPGPVAEALVHATREALANVAAHAGIGEAWVSAGLVMDGPVTAGPVPAVPAVEVTIRDAGRGFDPGLIGPTRLGVRMSISGRVADCGGSASVWSAPGEGTEVCLRWPAAAAAAPAPGPLAAAGSPAHREVPPC